MAEPPFQMPGHRWDPDKKRFFKILPGQSLDASSSSSSKPACGNIDKSKRKRDEEQASAEGHFATTPRLPVVNLYTPPRSSSSRSTSAFAPERSDPVSLKQKGRASVAAPHSIEQRRIEAAYSHLSLCSVRKIGPHLLRSNEVVSMQTDADDQFLLLLSGYGDIIRITPLSDISEFMSKGAGAAGLGLLWRSSQGCWQGLCDPDGTHHGLKYQPLQQQLPCNLLLDFFPDDGSTTIQSTFLSYPAPLRSQVCTAWAARELVLPHGNSAVLAVSTRKKIQVFGTDLPPRGPFFDHASNVFELQRSDIMAIALDLSGEKVFIGTRSGLVMVWQWRSTRQPRNSFRREEARTLLEGEGSVTNLEVVSSDELIVARINGQVQLVDTTTCQVKQHFKGHVNSYAFDISFAVEADSRLMALAGLDRRVRVWSLDSPLPLGTAIDKLPHIFHSATNGLGEDQQRDYQRGRDIYDDSTSESFRRLHPGHDGKPGAARGTTLSSMVFPKDVKTLHWHPRYAYESCNLHEIHALHQEQGPEQRQPQKRFKDLLVVAGEWLYQFRWP